MQRWPAAGWNQDAGWQALVSPFDGVAVVDPKAIPINPQSPPVIIEELLLDGKLMKPNPKGMLQIPPGAANLEIHYTGLSFVKSDHMRFKYKLEGLDQGWQDAGNRRTAYYPHLPAGHYRFTVIAANSDGIWNNTGASLRMIIDPPFWRTWWFSSIAIAFIVSSAVLAYGRRLKNLNQRNLLQEAFSRQLIESQESERKRIAAELHDSLSQTLSIIRSRALLCLNYGSNHEQMRDQVNEIAEAAVHALEEVKEIAHDLRPVEVDRLGLTKAIEEMVKDVADSTRMRLVADLDEIDGLFSGDAEINVYRIAQESLNNIIKHSAATEATFRARREGNRIEIVIQDNGHGFSPEAVKTGRERGSGFGLLGISERTRILGGKLRIQSAPGQGTTVSIVLAGKEKHEN